MKDLLLYIHTHKPFPSAPCDWQKTVSTVDVDGAQKIPQAMPGTRLDEFDAIRFAASSDATYVGVCHYRRRPFLNNQVYCTDSRFYIEPTEENIKFLTTEEHRQAALDILDSHDVIQYRPFMLDMAYRHQFSLFTPVAAWDIMLEVLAQLGLSESLGFYRVSNAHVWCSLFIAKRELVADFIGFALNVARLLGERTDYNALLNQNPRLTALLLERLTPLYVFHRRLRSAYVPMVCLEKTA